MKSVIVANCVLLISAVRRQSCGIALSCVICLLAREAARGDYSVINLHPIGAYARSFGNGAEGSTQVGNVRLPDLSFHAAAADQHIFGVDSNDRAHRVGMVMRSLSGDWRDTRLLVYADVLGRG
jgi:hypothetical protein